MNCPPLLRAWDRERARRWAVRALTLVVSLIVFSVFIRSGLNAHRPARYRDMVYGYAHRPYVTRALVPFVVRLVAIAVPLEARVHINQTLGETWVVASLFQIARWDTTLTLEFLTGTLLMYLSLLGFLAALRALFRALFVAPRWFEDLVPLGALLILPSFFWYVNYVYDLPNLFLFTLALAFLARRWWRPYLCVFFFATLNKETSILLTLIFWLHFRRDPALSRAAFHGLLLLQLALFALLRGCLLIMFIQNPGGTVDFQLLDFNLFIHPRHSLGTSAGYLLIALLIGRRWRQKPRFLRDALWILPPLLLLVLLFGYLDEIRALCEVYPIALMLAIPTVAEICEVPLRVRESEAPHPAGKAA